MVKLSTRRAYLFHIYGRNLQRPCFVIVGGEVLPVLCHRKNLRTEGSALCRLLALLTSRDTEGMSRPATT